MAMPWQCHGNAKGMPRHCHGNDLSATVPQGTQWSGCQSQFRSTSSLVCGLLVCGLQVCWSAFCRFSIGDPPPRFLRRLRRLRRPAWIFSHLFFMLLSNTFLETLGTSKNEYSCELGPQNDSKMEPKIEEKSNFVKK